MKFKKLDLSLFLATLCYTFLLFSVIHFSLEAYYQQDSYYHARMANLLWNEGIRRDFPWMQFSAWRDRFANKDFLFHLYLAPFCRAENTLIPGAKIGIGILAVALFAVFYLVIKHNKFRNPLLFYFLLLSSGPMFYQRMLVIRPHILSIILILLACHFIINQRHKSLFVLAAVYVLSHSSFLLVVALALVYTACFYAAERKLKLKIPASAILGVLTGLFLNPYFPNNLFWYGQLLQILANAWRIRTAVPQVLLGIELAPTFTKRFLMNPVTWVFFSIITWGMFSRKRRLSTKSLALFGMSMVVLALFLLSRRFVDYWEPVALLFCAGAFTDLSGDKPLRECFSQSRLTIPIIILLVGIIHLKGIHSFTNFFEYEKTVCYYRSFPVYREGAQWLKNNISPGETVYTVSWPAFSMLFFYNPQNYYIVGLDPTLLYYYDPDLFNSWYTISKGESSDMYEDIRNKFHSRYLFISRWSARPKLMEQINDEERFEQVYKDEYCAIYKLV